MMVTHPLSSSSLARRPSGRRRRRPSHPRNGQRHGRDVGRRLEDGGLRWHRCRIRWASLHRRRVDVHLDVEHRCGVMVLVLVLNHLRRLSTRPASMRCCDVNGEVQINTSHSKGVVTSRQSKSSTATSSEPR